MKTKEQVMEEGVQASKDGKHYSDNPYKKGTKEHTWWFKGWEVEEDCRNLGNG